MSPQESLKKCIKCIREIKQRVIALNGRNENSECIYQQQNLDKTTRVRAHAHISAREIDETEVNSIINSEDVIGIDHEDGG